MNELGPQPVPENHPIRPLFRTLTERGLGQINIRDEESLGYVSGLLLDFMRTDNLYPVRDEHGRRIEYLADLMGRADDSADLFERADHYKYLGDLTLFMLGLFPERFDRNRRSVSAEYYAQQGRRSYGIVADLAWLDDDPGPFRRLADGFDQYVRGLNWVKLYIQDPFFQYMFREFSIS